MPGTVVTFYSYKGGVGRSFALVNVATLLGRWGFRVLCIDWDLEAPGLEDFFRRYRVPTDSARETGVVELLTEFSKTRRLPLEWRPYVQKLDSRSLPEVGFIKAGLMDAEYMRRVQKLNWSALYKKGLGEALEIMFDELRSEYDFILLDSRTGVTEFSGIVTAQLPDILAFLFTANEQSLMGATAVAERAAKIRNDIALDRASLMLLPIPARFESQVEHYIASEWRERFASHLHHFYEGWAHKDVSVEKLIQASTIPYVPFWSFGERVAVVEDSYSDSSTITYSMENIAALLAHRLGQTKLLSQSRDEYVSAAQRLTRDNKPSIFISHATEDRDVARRLSVALETRGIRASLAADNLPVSSNYVAALTERLSSSSHFIAILGRKALESKLLNEEVRTFLRQAASDEQERILFPLLMPDVNASDLPSHIRHYRYSVLIDPDQAADEIVRQIRPSSNTTVDGGKLSIRVTTDGGLPLSNVQVCALAENGTSVQDVTEADGTTQLRLVPGKAYKVLAAHASYPSRIISDFVANKELNIRLRRRRNIGSRIVQTTGHIPLLEGRLSPIRDTLNRTYLYADNIAVNGGVRQPVKFEIDGLLPVFRTRD